MRYLLFLMLLSLPASAANWLHCNLAAFGNPVTWIPKLNEVPGLREQVARILADHDGDPAIQRILAGALARPNITIHQLTQELREAAGLPGSMVARHKFAGEPAYLVFSRDGVPDTLNNANTKNAKPYPLPEGNNVFVQDRPITKDQNDLSSLIHELAHVRFRDFLLANFERLAKTFPGLIRQRADKRYEIDDQLHTYLQERYAWETQRRAIKSLYGKYFDTWLAKYGTVEDRDDSDEAVRAEIADKVVRTYGITDQRILAMNRVKLSDILLYGLDTSATDRRQLPSNLELGLRYRFDNLKPEKQIQLMQRLPGYPVELIGPSGMGTRGMVIKVNAKSGTVNIRRADGNRQDILLSQIMNFRVGGDLPVPPPRDN